jgi:hypothetical protein
MFNISKQFGARDLLPLFTRCPNLVKITLESCEMNLEEFIKLVELLSSEEISPSLQRLELEPSYYEISVENSLRWAVAFAELEELILKVSPGFEMSQKICSCGGLLPSNLCNQCYRCGEAFPLVCYDCQTKLKISSCDCNSGGSYCDRLCCEECAKLICCKFCGDVGGFCNGSYGSDEPDSYATKY